MAYGFVPRRRPQPGARPAELDGRRGDSRPRIAATLRTYFLDHAGDLGDEFRERVEANPMRVLDAKRADWQDVIERAPQLTEHLDDDEQSHFEAVQRGLGALGIEYELAPRLVRGLDYYTSTTFEFAGDALDAAQNALGGGGRYDGLAEEMGGPPTPGIGFGIGIERLLLAADGRAGSTAPHPSPRSTCSWSTCSAGSRRTLLLHELRESAIRADRAYGGRSMKAQMKVADRSGAAFAVVLGPTRRRASEVSVKDLRTQRAARVPREQVAGWLRLRLEEGSGA